MISPLSMTYADARAAFLEAAASTGARIESFVHPVSGIEDEELAVDVAELGPIDNDRVILVVSGVHGVEGYLGSALQRHHLETSGGARSDGPDAPGAGEPTLIFIHALNPYGFSWVRRVNENNVDLNRNFVDWSKPRPGSEAYEPLAADLVPSSWSEEDQEQSLTALMAALQEIGMEAFQQAVSGGQYEYPDGVFYGGTEPVWSHTWLREFLGARLADVAHAVVVDLHTGLGPWGFGELISSESPDSPTYHRQREWWGEVTSHKGGDSVSAPLEGDWLTAVPGMAPDTEMTAIAIEYGTVDSVSVLQSLRADAVLHATGDPTSPDAVAIRDQVRAAFLDDDPEWLENCWTRYRSVVSTAAERLSD